jgi:photosystem II stability/assembly factor-like uncharacterized protein
MTRNAVTPVRFLPLAALLLFVGAAGPRPAEAPASPPVAALLENLPLRNIGPANMGGRIVAVAVLESNPATMYVATASGGLWKTVNNGESWTPLFDNQSTVSLGDVALAPSNPDIVWVGTGEANARNSVSWGDGLYKSTDGGKTWQHMGLKDSHHIGRIVIHPKNPNIVYVAALGHFWGPNKERGLYKTSDGGKTWQKSKYIDDDTGFIDVAMDPVEPNILYAAAYAVRRDAFSGGNPALQCGPNAGLFRTTDGGKTWEKMTEGLPDRPYGRCGFNIYRKDPNIVYAVVQTDKTEVSVKGQVASQKLSVEKGGIFRSEDKGKTWVQVNTLCPRPFYYGQIRIDPNDDKRIYVLGVSFFVSNDRGKTFTTGTKGAHPDHHALWINPKNSKHLVLGNDGGLYFSQTRGASWEKVQNLPIGQFYGVAVDMRKPYRVYGGLQDNGSWGGPSATHHAEGITLKDWVRVLGADGFQCQVDPTDPDIVYVEAQYGKPQRFDLRTKKKGTQIQPRSANKAVTYRFNWNTPMLISPHNPRTLYYGGNFLFRSDNRGDIWKIISPDLTRGKPGPSKSTGHTLTTIAESPLKAGILFVGSDDGKVHVTRDGGKKWTDLSEKIPGVPPDRWITRLECSHFAEGTAYLTISRYRNEDYKPYVFKTTDFGETWHDLTNNLPKDGPVHVIRESSRNKNLLFAGTEFGLFVSLDGGNRWQRVRNGLPTVAVHDLVIHPRDRELVIGTHGRSIYVLDVAPLEELTPKVLASEAHLFTVKPATTFVYRKADAPENAGAPRMAYVAPNPPYGARVYYYLKETADQPVTLTILDAAGKKVASVPGTKKAGIQQLMWDLRRTEGDGKVVPAGEYTARLQVGERVMVRKVQVESEK